MKDDDNTALHPLSSSIKEKKKLIFSQKTPFFLLFVYKNKRFLIEYKRCLASQPFSFLLLISRTKFSKNNNKPIFPTVVVLSPTSTLGKVTNSITCMNKAELPQLTKLIKLVGHTFPNKSLSFLGKPRVEIKRNNSS